MPRSAGINRPGLSRGAYLGVSRIQRFACADPVYTVKNGRGSLLSGLWPMPSAVDSAKREMRLTSKYVTRAEWGFWIRPVYPARMPLIEWVDLGTVIGFARFSHSSHSAHLSLRCTQPSNVHLPITQGIPISTVLT